MRTLLSQFCEEFGAVVTPLLDPLQNSSDSLAAVGSDSPVARLLPGLRDRTHQLRALATKVEEQQAYVLIFGPLKSGKSTLMNAVAGSYVSEVTTLPAYPCMVFVSYSPRRAYQLTRYDGSVETLHDAAALRMAMNRAHAELAERIREVEATGADFEPVTHFPQAIRQLDVRVPAASLKESGTVVVDTPGLYSRMKFGYDRMTREFRDTATCAIFVVKTDNLFLEQVFEEFHQLLELFSKIFLVVNLDTTKRDLRPDGSLVPSLESEDPIRLIEAFENLSMSNPLKQAREEGRLQIYPVDLMNAASRRLSESFRESPAEADDSRQSSFDTFLGDLTQYLDSDEYLVSFLGDSLRQADGVIRNLGDLLEDASVRELKRHIAGLEEARDRAQQQVAAVERLKAFAWSEHFGALQSELAEAAEVERDGLSGKTERELAGAVDHWFQETSSLKSLVENDLAVVLRNLQAEIVSTQMAALRRRIHRQPAGLELPAEIARAAEACDLNLTATGKAAVEEIDGGAALEHAEIPLHRTAIPVRKGLWDWLLFRGADKVRHKVLGGKGEHRLTRTQKQKRLGALAQKFMNEECEDALASFLPRTDERLAAWLTQSYAHHGVRAIVARLEQVEGEARAQAERAQTELDRVASLNASFGELADAVSRAESGLDSLTDRYASTEAGDLELEVDEAAPETEAATETEAEHQTEAAGEAEASTEASTDASTDEEIEIGAGETDRDRD